VYSKIMAWVALARGSEVARQQGGESAGHWLAEAELVRADIEAKGWNEAHRGYTMYYGSPSLDGALLRIAALGFEGARAPRAQATVAAVRRSLADGPFVFRHSLPDGRRGPEASFLLLGFWLVQALALAGEHDEASQLFEELRRKQSPLGLYSELFDPAAGRLVGNFPQGFSHQGLIEAALALAEKPETTHSSAAA
ncbi:MAG: glycoside hydrolase family 15 protein, partial [Chloroflexota bacterium]